MVRERRKWTRDELIIAFNLYCKIPFSKINYRLPQIQEFAALINRTPSAVAWKLVNFASLDPALKARNISGAKNKSKLDEEIFNEFYGNWNDLVIESEMKSELLSMKNKPQEILLDEKTGKDIEVIVKVRVNQSFFRKAILATYEGKCCITGTNIPELLRASHIIPWSIKEETRLNPENGLCLDSLHDQAFDQGLITLDTDYRVVISNRIASCFSNQFIKQSFAPYEGKQIIMPKRFVPNQDFIEYHRQHIFKK